MRFLLLSGRGRGCAMMMRLREEGHDVGVWIRHGRYKHNWENLLPRVDHWEKFLTSDSTVIFDSPGGGSTADRLRSKGYTVVCGSTLADQLMEDAEFQKELLRGVELPQDGLITCWFDGQNFLPWSFLSRQVVRFMSGDLGPTTECAGCTGQWRDFYTPLRDMESFLSNQGYRGVVNLDLTGLSLSPSFDSFTLLISSLEKVGGLFGFKEDFSPNIDPLYSVRVTIPPYPNINERSKIDLPVEGWQKDDRRWVYPYDIKLTDKGQLVTSGGEGLIASVMGKSWDEAYERVRRVEIPSIQYRVDLADLLREEVSHATTRVQ